MNWLLFASGIFAAFTTVGHFVVGSKKFLNPMLEASFDDVPKKIMHCVFHYISVNLVLSTIVLIALGIGISLDINPSLLVKFIAVHYLAYAIVQIIIALTSKIHNAMFKMSQWVFFILIAVFVWLGVS
jgi:hypothetical protein